VRQDLEALARLCDGYNEALYRLGLIRPADGDVAPIGGPPVVNAVQVNVFDQLSESIRDLPEDLRAEFFSTLRKIRETKARARMAETDRIVAARMPPEPEDEPKE
jgi:hypothetical protein